MSDLQKFKKLYKASTTETKILTVFGFILSIIYIFLLIFGKFVVPHDPLEITDKILYPFSLEYPMGTDRLGRCVLSRMIAGTYYSLTISIISVLMSMIIGTILGALSGYIGGLLDTILSLLMDALWVFPTFVLALVIALVMGSGIINTSIAVAIVAIPVFYRVIRSHTLTIKQREFIEAEKLINAPPLYIIRKHIMPFYTSSLLVLITLRLAQAILNVSGLGFLGLGINPPTPEWGTDLALGRFEITSGHWWLTLFPGLMILFAILGFNLLGEGLDEILKPITGTQRE
jgi:peptide/nickel transport system permease protein